MLTNTIYSVISPEGCASILWKDTSRAEQAAAALKLTAHDLLKLGIIDGIVEEPDPGAHEHPEETGRNLKRLLLKAFDELFALPPDELLRQRYEKYRRLGEFAENNGGEI